VHHRVQRGGERQARVLPAVGQDREAAGRGLHHDLPRGEDGDRDDPGRVVGGGPPGAPRDLDEPDEPERDRQQQHRFPGQHAVAERRGGQQRVPLAVRVDAGDQAQRAQRFGQVTGQAVHHAEIAGQQQPPQRVPARLLRDQAAQVAQGAERRDVDRDQRVRHRRVLPGRQRPGQRGVSDPHKPVRRVHGDAERGLVQVGRIQRHPVVELAVIAGRTGEDPDPARYLGRVAVDRADPEQLRDVAAVQQDQPALDRGQRGQEGKDCGQRGPVQPAGGRSPPRLGRIAGRG
jgi:hypothetical protein